MLLLYAPFQLELWGKKQGYGLMAGWLGLETSIDIIALL